MLLRTNGDARSLSKTSKAQGGEFRRRTSGVNGQNVNGCRVGGQDVHKATPNNNP